MQTFFFPVLWLVPKFEPDVFRGNGFAIHRRKWEVSIFDLYSLIAQKHPVRLPVELMHIFLGSVNVEIEISANDFHAASEVLERIRLILCIHGVMPTIAPFAANMSINAYAGINHRSSTNLREKLPEDLRAGTTHDNSRVETWPLEVSFSCIHCPEDHATFILGDEVLIKLSNDLPIWTDLERQQGVLRAARKAFVKAPLMPDLSSSVLQIWQGLESLFPTVNAEVTFRTSILLAMLLARFEDKVDTFNKSKESYSVRSKIAHGSQAEINIENWMQAWSLLRDALKSVILWGRLPSDKDLTMLLVGGATF